MLIGALLLNTNDMNELIKITQSTGGKNVVSARELYTFLSVDNGSHFNQWATTNIENMFLENIDFQTISHSSELSNRQMIDYAVTIQCAKEISMMSRCERGKHARLYFIECEKIALNKTSITLPDFNDPVKAARAWADEREQNQLAEKKIIELAPKAEVYDQISDATNYKSVGEVAKIIGTGRNKLFDFMRDKKILMANNLPYQNFINSGYFVVKTNIIKDLNKDNSQVFFTAKGELWIAKLFKE